MILKANIHRLFILILAAVLAACAGGETGTGFNDVSVGTITGFGSVFVNGIEFDTQDTQFKLEGKSGSETDLKIGMVVFIGGTIDDTGLTGKADELILEEVLKGIVQSNDGSSSLVVLGQTVQIGAATVFDNAIQPNNISGIAVNDIVEISGHVISDGLIQATRIEILDANYSEYELKGYVQNHNGAEKAFDVGSLHVDYSGAQVENVSLDNGVLIKLKGSYDTGRQLLVAKEIEQEKLHVQDAEKIEIEGIVNQFVTLDEFSINTIPIKVTAATEYDGGLAAEIMLGSYLEVEGSLAAGVLTAKKIKFEESVKLEANIDTISNNQMTLIGLNGIVITLVSTTEITGITPLQSGNHVEIRGSSNASQIVASEINSEDSNDNVMIQAPVQSISNPNITLLGFEFNTTSELQEDAYNVDGADNSQAGLFQVLKVNDLVSLEGKIDQGGTVQWEKLKRED